MTLFNNWASLKKELTEGLDAQKQSILDKVLENQKRLLQDEDEAQKKAEEALKAKIGDDVKIRLTASSLIALNS